MKMTKNRRSIVVAIACIVMSAFLLTVGATAVDKSSSRKLNSRSEILTDSMSESIVVRCTVPGIKGELIFGIIPKSKYTPITDYNDRAQVENMISIYVSAKLNDAQMEFPNEYTYTIRFPKGMETPTWAKESPLTAKDPKWLTRNAE